MTRLSASWHSAKVVRTRDKLTFFLGVMSVLVSALIFGIAPEFVYFMLHRNLKLTMRVPQMDTRRLHSHGHVLSAITYLHV